MFVLVVDTGSLFSERHVIQNASDAATFALVRECAINGNGEISGLAAGYSSPVCESAVNALDFSSKYANLNSPDALTEVTSVCGKSPLNNCAPSSSAIFDCKEVNPQYLNYVRVRTQTKTQGGNSITNLFSSILNSSDAGTTVPGCAQGAWGKANFAPVLLPIALPICNYGINGTSVLKDFSSNEPTVVGGCTVVDLGGQSFYYSSPTAGFSFISGFDGCLAMNTAKQIKVGDFLGSASLLQVAQPCGGSTQFYNQLSTIIGSIFFVPVITNVLCNKSGSTNCQGSYQFQVASFFAFKLLGLKFKNSALLGALPVCPEGETCGSGTDYWPSYCGSASSCIYGTFSRGVVPGADVSTDPNLPAVGAQAIQLLP